MRQNISASKFTEGQEFRPGIDKICEMVEGYKGAQSIFLEIRQYETEFKMREGFELDPEQPNVDNYS